MRLILLTLLLTSSSAQAGEAFAGLAAHGVDLGFVSGRYERGTDLIIGVRSAPVARLGSADLRVHALASINLNGETSFAAAGASLRFPLGSQLYVAPGIGLAVHDGAGDKFQRTPDRLYLGSRVVFAPELSVGVRLSRRVALEAAYLHLSHAQLAGSQNPGLDTIGARVVVNFGR